MWYILPHPNRQKHNHSLQHDILPYNSTPLKLFYFLLLQFEKHFQDNQQHNVQIHYTLRQTNKNLLCKHIFHHPNWGKLDFRNCCKHHLQYRVYTLRLLMYSLIHIQLLHHKQHVPDNKFPYPNKLGHHKNFQNKHIFHHPTKDIQHLHNLNNFRPQHKVYILYHFYNIPTNRKNHLYNTPQALLSDRPHIDHHLDNTILHIPMVLHLHHIRQPRHHKTCIHFLL